MNATDDRTAGGHAGVDLNRRGSAQWMLDRTSGTRRSASNRQITRPVDLDAAFAELDAGDAEAQADAERIRHAAADALARARARGQR